MDITLTEARTTIQAFSQLLTDLLNSPNFHTHAKAAGVSTQPLEDMLLQTLITEKLADLPTTQIDALQPMLTAIYQNQPALEQMRAKVTQVDTLATQLN